MPGRNTCDFCRGAPTVINIIQPGSKVTCRDQCTRQMHAFEQSKVTPLAKIEADIAIVDKQRMVNKLNVQAGSPRSTTADRM